MTAIDDRVTVFIPVRHFHEKFLREAVASVLAQTRADWSMLLVVHPEAELPVRTMLRTELEDSRARVVVQEGANLAGGYNTAMRACGTPFIAALLGDDLLARDAIEILGAAIRAHPEGDFFHTGRHIIDEDGRRISSDYLPTLPVNADAFRRVSPVKHLMCWRASRGIACGGVDESLENFGSDDYDFPWTMLDHGATFVAIHQALYIYRDHRQAFRLTTHVPRSRQTETLRRILSKHGVPEPEVRAVVRRARRGYLRQSLFRNPLHQWFMERIGLAARTGWREPYR